MKHTKAQEHKEKSAVRYTSIMMKYIQKILLAGLRPGLITILEIKEWISYETVKKWSRNLSVFFQLCRNIILSFSFE